MASYIGLDGGNGGNGQDGGWAGDGGRAALAFEAIDKFDDINSGNGGDAVGRDSRGGNGGSMMLGYEASQVDRTVQGGLNQRAPEGSTLNKGINHNTHSTAINHNLSISNRGISLNILLKAKAIQIQDIPALNRIIQDGVIHLTEVTDPEGDNRTDIRYCCLGTFDRTALFYLGVAR
ncbi:hypothetical protein SISNIDRAFT_468069 [Sistotremastrum niveocremeum HHB9708]|uniref:Uncharacterized protein n=1 Tax=Sistotremastrum niveocremeum HHB9708 TaxID=1314777 RepID=A0A164S4F3_9AGAM|nr:hypothetical protein SISNIDRAFT_468069 [Sistotremastrum niveocremeum HHB9708]